MVAQEDRPLTVARDVRRLPQDVGDREAVFLGDGHVHARHQREVERHVAFVAGAAVFAAEVQLGVLRPLVGLGQQHAVGVIGVDLGADGLEHRVGLGQVFVVGAVTLDQVGNRVQAQTVDAHVQPEAHDGQYRLHHLRVVEIQIRLVGIEAVPEVLLGHRVPGPVGLLGVEKDDPRALVFVVGVGPDVEIARRRALLRLARALEPGVLVRGVVDDQLGDHPQPALVRFGNEAPCIGHVAVLRMHAAVVGDVVAVIAPRRGIERQQPDGVHAQIGDVVQLLDQPDEVTNAVIVGIVEGFQVHLVHHRVLVPERILDECGRFARFCHVVHSCRNEGPRSFAARATTKLQLEPTSTNQRNMLIL